jgi:hypothetical protein
MCICLITVSIIHAKVTPQEMLMILPASVVGVRGKVKGKVGQDEDYGVKAVYSIPGASTNFLD